MKLSYEQKAADLFYQGYNCAQAVVGAYEAQLPVSFDNLMKLASGLGGGFGSSGEVCGALTGAVLVINLLKGANNPSDKPLKQTHYARINRLMETFKTDQGSVLCRQLLEDLEVNPKPTTQIPAKRCEYFVRYGARLVSDFITLENQT